MHLKSAIDNAAFPSRSREALHPAPKRMRPLRLTAVILNTFGFTA
jgi:hypothetical protein